MWACTSSVTTARAVAGTASSTGEQVRECCLAGVPALTAQCNVAVGLTAHDLVLVGVAAGAGADICAHGVPLAVVGLNGRRQRPPRGSGSTVTKFGDDGFP